HYDYVDLSELTGLNPATLSAQTFTITFNAPIINPDGSFQTNDDGTLQTAPRTVMFHRADLGFSDTGFGLIRPPEWTGRRRAPGEIQMARSELLQSFGQFQQALTEYDNLIVQIEDTADLLEEQHHVNVDQIEILDRTNNEIRQLNREINGLNGAQLVLRRAASVTGRLAEGTSQILANCETPLVECGVTDTAAFGVLGVGVGIAEGLEAAADIFAAVQLDRELTKDRVEAQGQLEIITTLSGLEETRILKELEQLIRQEASQRLALYTLQEAMQQAQGRYLAAVATGQRLLEERVRFRQQTAANIQNYRYQDLTFRIFRNDALQKYRAQFDLAALYVYLATTAYDFETNLLESDGRAGQTFLTHIVRQRSLGQIINGQPVIGSGLVDTLARLNANFLVLRGQLGFNNPQTETNRFSLRSELLRITQDPNDDDIWRTELENHRVANLWDIPGFRRYCRPFALESAGPQPGIVIPVQTNIT
ncbi:MAG: hypothetical protein MN733_18640, partial [Nitrososphaera sp.]|nr:hypothetical protein [Nitrososphaera sp.]